MKDEQPVTFRMRRIQKGIRFRARAMLNDTRVAFGSVFQLFWKLVLFCVGGCVTGVTLSWQAWMLASSQAAYPLCMFFPSVARGVSANGRHVQSRRKYQQHVEELSLRVHFQAHLLS